MILCDDDWLGFNLHIVKNFIVVKIKIKPILYTGLSRIFSRVFVTIIMRFYDCDPTDVIL